MPTPQPDGLPDAPPDIVAVTVVQTDGCHFCRDAHEVLGGLADQGYPIKVTTVDLRRLMDRH